MIYNIFLLLCALVTISYGSNAPVIIWGTSSDPKSALNLVSSNELAEQIRPKLSDSLLLVFVEKKLSSEDLSYCKIDSGSTCYGNLSKFAPYTYYTNVETPVEVLRNIGDRKEYVVVDSEGVLDNHISYKAGKVVFVNFEDNESESRDEKLRNHDDVISKLWQELSSQGKVIAVYTGLESSNALQRQTRQATARKDETVPTPNWFALEEKLLMYYASIKYAGDYLTINEKSLHDKKPNLYDVELTDDRGGKITFEIKIDGDYWSLENLKYKDVQFRISPAIIIPKGFSYCGGTLSFPGEHGDLVIEDLQIEAFTEKGPKTSFGDAWHGVGFTSPGIWSGLFVTFMLLGIMTIGILWLMDIKTMDRFDDPKGKTITINAAE